MYDEDGEDLESQDRTIRSKVDGPFGPTWIIVNQRSQLPHLEAIYRHKLKVFMDRTGKTEATIFDLLQDPDNSSDAFKLDQWIRERQRQRLDLSVEEREQLKNREENEFSGLLSEREQVFGRILSEEEQGERVTIYSDDDQSVMVSLTQDSPRNEAATVLGYFGEYTSSKQKEVLQAWAKEPLDQPIAELDNEPLKLKKLNGEGFDVLTNQTHPDILRAATMNRMGELGKTGYPIVQRWIEGSAQPDSPQRVRIFHQGLDEYNDSTELNLERFSIDYIEHIYKHISQARATLLPEHKQRLDDYYEALLERQKDPSFAPMFIEIPRSLKGESGSFTLTKNADKEVLYLAYDIYGDRLNEKNKDLLWKWYEDAPWKQPVPESIRVYGQTDLNKFRVLHKYKDAEEIEKSLRDQNSLITPYDAEKAEGWIRVLQPIPPQDPKQEKAICLHSSRFRIEVTLSKVQDEPDKFNELLNDGNWTTTSRNRLLIQSCLRQADRTPEEEIVYNGETFTRNSSLSNLHELADYVAEQKFGTLAPESAKKLMTWIHTKEKFGDDYFLDKSAPQPEPVPLHPYEEIKAQQRNMDMAFAEIRKEITRSNLEDKPTKEIDKEKNDPFPSL